MEKEYVIGLNRGVDTVQFWKDVETITNLDNIPNRAVEVANSRSGSNRLTHYYLTDEEAELIRQDERVYVVEIPAYQRDDIEIGFKAIQPSGSDNHFTKAPDSDGNSFVDATGSFKNWGLVRHKSLSNNYGTSFETNESYTYTLDGEGVDIVIQDSGIEANHPEWEDEDGNSRLQQIDWFSASGISGTQPNGFYTDYDGHGTHCAGIAAGKTFGFAKNANIYAQKLAGLEGSSDPNTGIFTDDAFDTIRLWHANKSGSRPTVVNMSWGYGATLSANNVSNIHWRGADYTSGNPALDYGISTYDNFNPWRIEARASSVDVEIQEMIDAGIHVVIAAGNLNYKCEVTGGVDYDNYFTHGGSDYYYHRGSSPYDDEAIKIGSMNYASHDVNTDKKSSFSNAGPAVDIYAGGHFIVSAMSNTHNGDYTIGAYDPDDNYKQAVLSGTSMAAPNVAGVIALMCQANPKATPSSIKSSLLAKAGDAFLTGSATNDYTDDSTMGGDNKVLFNPFSQTSEPGNVSGIELITANLMLS
jgi:subtilisin family serine protease